MNIQPSHLHLAGSAPDHVAQLHTRIDPPGRITAPRHPPGDRPRPPIQRPTATPEACADPSARPRSGPPWSYPCLSVEAKAQKIKVRPNRGAYLNTQRPPLGHRTQPPGPPGIRPWTHPDSTQTTPETDRKQTRRPPPETAENAQGDAISTTPSGYQRHAENRPQRPASIQPAPSPNDSASPSDRRYCELTCHWWWATPKPD